MAKDSQAFWLKFFRIVRYRSLPVAAAVACLTVLLFFYARHVPLRSSYFDLLPQGDPVLAKFSENQEYLSVSNSLVLLIQLRESVSADERATILLRAGEALCDSLRTNPEIISATYVVEPPPSLPDQYVLLQQLSAERIRQITTSYALVRDALSGVSAGHVSPGADLGDAYALAATMLTPSGLADADRLGTAARLGLGDLLALNEAVLQGLEFLPKGMEIAAATRHVADLLAPQVEVARQGQPLFSRDGGSLIVSAKARQPAQDVAYCESITHSVEQNIAAADPERLGVSVALTGSYVIITETNEVVNADMRRSELITGAGVLLLFLLSFGSVFYSLIASAPLVIALVVTAAWTRFGMAGFNLITVFVPSLILGMGDDFAVHLISRFLEERGRSVGFSRALFTMLARKGSAIVVGALTIALVFASLMTARSRALFEMGAIAMVGILAALVCALIVIPTLLTVLHRLRRRRARRKPRVDPTPHLQAFFSWITRPALARGIVVAVAAVTAGATYLATGVRFEFSSSDLVPDIPSQRTRDAVLASFLLNEQAAELGTTYLFFAADGEEMAHVSQALAAHPLVLAVETPSQFLPANLAEQQAALRSFDVVAYADQVGVLDRALGQREKVLSGIPKLVTALSLVQYAASLNGYRGLAGDAARAQDQLVTIRDQLMSLDVDAARETTQSLEAAVRSLEARLGGVRELPPAETLLRDILQALPPEMEVRYLTGDGRYIVRALLHRRLFEDGNLEAFDRFASSISSDYFGVPQATQGLERTMKTDFYRATSVAAALIFLLVWRSARSLKRAVLMLSPMILSYAWMLGGMRLLGISFNFINISISPLLIGLGVESAVTLLFRYDEERERTETGAMVRASSTTVVAICTSLFTTMLVFATLLFARTPGLRLLGTCAILGLGSSLLLSLVLVPACVSLRRRPSRACGPRSAA